MMAMVESGEVRASGGNSFGQLGLGHRVSAETPQRVEAFLPGQVSRLACRHHSAAITFDGELYLWGTGAFGEYLAPQKMKNIDSPVTDVSLGGCFGVATDSDGKIWAWGSNRSGELGLGDCESRALPCCVSATRDTPVARVACGTSHVVALLASAREKSETSASPRTSRRIPGKIEAAKTTVLNFRHDAMLQTMLLTCSPRGLDGSIRIEDNARLFATVGKERLESTGTKAEPTGPLWENEKTPEERKNAGADAEVERLREENGRLKKRLEESAARTERLQKELDEAKRKGEHELEGKLADMGARLRMYEDSIKKTNKDRDESKAAYETKIEQHVKTCKELGTKLATTEAQ